MIKKIIHPFSLRISLINFKRCVLHPENFDSYVGIFFSLIFLIIPLFLGLTNYLKTDGNVVVIIFAITWVYNWIKYTYLADKSKLDNILQKNHPFFQKYLESFPVDSDPKNLMKNGLAKIQEEYNIPIETINRIFTENPYWQKLCGKEFFEASPLPIEELIDTKSPSISQNDQIGNETDLKYKTSDEDHRYVTPASETPKNNKNKIKKSKK